MNGFKSRILGRVRERSPLILEPLEQRMMLSGLAVTTAVVQMDEAGTTHQAFLLYIVRATLDGLPVARL